jgi:hypothetical protein
MGRLFNQNFLHFFIGFAAIISVSLLILITASFYDSGNKNGANQATAKTAEVSNR